VLNALSVAVTRILASVVGRLAGNHVYVPVLDSPLAISL
jgi:hypothetical protein